jgi:hypothetical protein
VGRGWALEIETILGREKKNGIQALGEYHLGLKKVDIKSKMPYVSNSIHLNNSRSLKLRPDDELTSRKPRVNFRKTFFRENLANSFYKK